MSYSISLIYAWTLCCTHLCTQQIRNATSQRRPSSRDAHGVPMVARDGPRRHRPRYRRHQTPTARLLQATQQQTEEVRRLMDRVQEVTATVHQQPPAAVNAATQTSSCPPSPPRKRKTPGVAATILRPEPERLPPLQSTRVFRPSNSVIGRATNSAYRRGVLDAFEHLAPGTVPSFGPWLPSMGVQNLHIAPQPPPEPTPTTTNVLPPAVTFALLQHSGDLVDLHNIEREANWGNWD